MNFCELAVNYLDGNPIALRALMRRDNAKMLYNGSRLNILGRYASSRDSKIQRTIEKGVEGREIFAAIPKLSVHILSTV